MAGLPRHIFLLALGENLLLFLHCGLQAVKVELVWILALSLFVVLLRPDQIFDFFFVVFEVLLGLFLDIFLCLLLIGI